MAGASNPVILSLRRISQTLPALAVRSFDCARKLAPLRMTGERQAALIGCDFIPRREATDNRLWSKRVENHNRLWSVDGLANNITAFRDDNGAGQARSTRDDNEGMTSFDWYELWSSAGTVRLGILPTERDATNRGSDPA